MRTPTPPEKSLIEIFPNWLTDGAIFSQLTCPPPWKSWDVSALALDVMYIGNISGEKLASPLLRRLLDSDGTISQASMAILVDYISDTMYPQWEKLFATYNIHYNPLHNHSEFSRTLENHRDEGAKTLTKGTQSSRTTSTNEHTDIDDDSTQQSDRSAYNATTYAPVDKITTNTDTDKTVAYQGLDSTVHSGSDSEASNNKGGYSITKTSSGFNGNYTYQRVLRDDRELWKANYFDIVFSHLDNILTIPIYQAESRPRIGYSRGYPYI